MPKVNRTPKVLYVDIETSPNIALIWRSGYRISVSPDNIIEERKIICVSYKWADEDKVHSITWSARQDDKKLLKQISKILLEADSIIAHNGDKFDIRWINGRLLYHRLSPLGQLPTDDTLKQSRRYFELNSHKLDYIGKFLQIGEKIKTGGLDLWKRVLLDNDRKALDEMVRYCEGDVILLQEAHEEMAPYIKPKQHMGILIGGTREDCPSCGDSHVIKDGIYTSRMGKYQQYKCQECGHRFKDTRQIKKV